MKSHIATGLVFATILLGSCSSDTPSATGTETIAETTLGAGTAAPTTTPASTTETPTSAPANASTTIVEPVTPSAVPATGDVPPAGPAVSVAVEDPNYKEATADVTTKTCKQSGTSWQVGGTVTNRSGADAKYKIVVSLLPVGGTVAKAIVKVDVEAADGATVKWASLAGIADPGLTCEVRAKRAAA